MSVRRSYDVIVIGCGGIGSAAAYWLARAGASVLCLEQFELGHHNGSSQDHSRIIRRSYHDPNYTVLARPAYELWDQIEQESGVHLVTKCGGLDFERLGTTGPKDLSHCAAAMTEQGVPFEELDAKALMERWPQLTLDSDVRGLFQPDGGLVDPGKSIAVHVALARLHGAEIKESTAVTGLKSTSAGVEVVTSGGTFGAQHVVLTCGAWTNDLLGHLGLRWPLTITQEQVTYFATPHIADFAPNRFPVWIWRAPTEFYGFPVYGEVATKAGQDVGGPEVTTETRTFEPDAPTRQRLVDFLLQTMPGFVGPELYTKTCLYTMPPDRNFVIDFVPGYENVSVVADAAHAFKFATLIGKIMSELALDGATGYPIDAFRADRPALTGDFAPIFRNEAVMNHG
ncbi:MAG: N-methyl-L-tryptophan oxidase [Thermomicrobiales bacterium]|nr:N-methyl-L-tryptophan oxidase [Thermomicrobiales bacterium]